MVFYCLSYHLDYVCLINVIIDVITHDNGFFTSTEHFTVLLPLNLNLETASFYVKAFLRKVFDFLNENIIYFVATSLCLSTKQLKEI